MPQTLFAPPLARVLHVGVEVGLFERLARGGAASADELAGALDLRPAGTRHLCDCLAAVGHLKIDREGRYRLARRSRRWLDPASPHSVAGYVAHSATYWDWWGDLEGLVREGRHVELHEAAADDASWRSYIRGQFELARLSAPEVARSLRVAPGATSLLDVAGAHGLFAAALCERHRDLRATVLDLPGSVAVGRELLGEHGGPGAARVTHVEGDATVAELGGPHDVVLLFNFVHHLDEAQTAALLSRVHAAIRPGGTLAILDLFAPAPGVRRPGQIPAFLGLFFHLTSGADVPDHRTLGAQLKAAGFEPATATSLRAVPAQTLLQAPRL